jgi:CHASE3 domain sensor protein/signal transduction histidine kinase
VKLDLKLTVAFALGLLIIVVVGIGSFVNIQQVAESNRMVAHSREVLASLERTLSLLKDAETGQRGFVLTGEERYLGPYKAAVTEIGKETESLAALTKDNPAQQQSIRQLAQLSHEKLEELQTTIKLRRESGLNAALTVIRTDRGKRVMDEIRAVVARMEARERQLLDERNRIAGETALRNSRTVGLGMLLMLLLLAAAAVVMTRLLHYGGRRARPESVNGKRAGITLRYLFALAMAVLAMLLRHWMVSSYGPMYPFITFYPSIMLVAIIAGGGPGILTTFVSVLAADYWYLPPFGEFAIGSPHDAIALGVFGSSCLFLSVFAERLHRARLGESVSAAQERELELLGMGNLLALDLDRRVVRWSQGCSRLYSYDAQEAQGHLVDELLQTRNAQSWGETQRTLLEHGYWEGEITRRGKNGIELSVTILLALRRDDHGTPSAILEVSTDLTTQKSFQAALQANEVSLQAANDNLRVVNEQLQAQTEELQTQSEELQSQAEELLSQNHELAKLWDESRSTKDALAESQERLVLALSSSDMGIFEWDIVNDRRFWDDGVHRLLMTNPRTFTGTADEFYRVIHPDDRDIVQNALAKAVNTDGAYDTEYRAVWPDGTIHHIAARGKIHRTSAGHAYHMTGICWDISERKLAEEKLQKLNGELEERVAERTKELAVTVEKLRVEIIERENAEESVLRLNRLYKVVSQTSLAIMRTMDRETIFEEFCRIAVDDGSFKLAWVGLVDEESGELKVAASQGATGYLDDLKIAVNDEEPEDSGPTCISVREGTYYICNDFLGSPATRLWHERGRVHDIHASASIALKQEGQVIGALTLYADKKDFFDRQQIELLQQMGADVSFALDNIVRENRHREAERSLRDETIERLRATEALREKEQMLIQQSRQAAMGEMIGNIAHQWRQPLNTLGLTIQQLSLYHDLGEFTKEFLENSVGKAMQLIQHMSNTIDDFRNYFKPDKEKIEFKVQEAINSTLSLIEDSFKSQHIGVELVTTGDPVIHGYRNEFAQVILNILNNARDVLTEREIRDPKVWLAIGSENGRAVVTIADNAGGVPKEIVDRIFDPYFTTKGPQTGTGVGLFMSKTIIEKNMGGRLTVQNTANGAEFRIKV